MTRRLDAVVVGSGPNGLAAAVELARAGYGVRVIEARDEPGGGTRTRELTLPGFWHDECSAIHPLGILSPYFRRLPLAEHGLEWLQLEANVAHPLDGQPAVMLYRSFERTAERLDDADGRAWRRLVEPFLEHGHDLLADILGPVTRWPRRPLAMARFGWYGMRPATLLARRFAGERARALLAGCAAHSVLPLTHLATSAVALMFAVTAHLEAWPCARGGSRAISAALASYLRSLGGEIECGRPVTSLAELPASRVVLFDLSPAVLVKIAGDALPRRYVKRLERFRYGPATFKVDWALDGPIPWTDPEIARATTVHVGGPLAEIARSERDAWEGRPTERPFLILCQQSHADPSRAPEGKHTGYAYCHLPAGSDVDMTERIEAQIERFAPGFRDRVLARHTTSPREFEAGNPNYVGGAITGGSAEIGQLFTRPVARLDPYATPNPRLFICSASTPPGGGVHGMCGYFAARSAIRRLGKSG